MAAGFTRRILLTVLTTLLLIQPPSAFAADGQKGQEQAPVYERVIAHGGGSYRGYETTNSVEAVNNAIANGFKIIELDMELSSDGRVIMLHDWDRTAKHYYGTSFPKKLSQAQFSRLSVHGKLEVLTLDKLVRILKKHGDVRIVTDTKGDNLSVLNTIAEQYPDLVSRFIPQIYDYGQWREVRELGFSDIIFTLYAMADPDMEKLSEFVKTHEIYAVAMPDYYAEKGYCKELSDKGITVYIHPVSGYEEAIGFMKQGAYGVYSGSLLPEEFAGVEKDYYLTAQSPRGTAVKLADERIRGFGDLILHGRKQGDAVLFYLDQSLQCVGEEAFLELQSGKHRLTVRILNGQTVKGTLIYYLWKDTDHCRIVHKKYEYRLDALGSERDFGAVLQDGNVPEEIRSILEHSLIAREGESVFYADGRPERYTNGAELLAVRKGSHGKLMLPLSATLQYLGASSVTMDKGRDISIVFHKEKSMIMADTNIVRKGFRLTRLRFPVTLYLNKAMAAGEFYRCVTGRNFIENSDTIILLPEGANPGKTTEKLLLDAAGSLFQSSGGGR